MLRFLSLFDVNYPSRQSEQPNSTWIHPPFHRLLWCQSKSLRTVSLDQPCDLTLCLSLFIYFLDFLLNLLPGFHVFSGTEQPQAHPCCPLVPVPASSVSHHSVRMFLGHFYPGFSQRSISHGMPQLESLECLCMALLKVFNLPELKIVSPKALRLLM